MQQLLYIFKKYFVLFPQFQNHLEVPELKKERNSIARKVQKLLIRQYDTLIKKIKVLKFGN